MKSKVKAKTCVSCSKSVANDLKCFTDKALRDAEIRKESEKNL